ncbi:TonB C-terminal domain-containing protein [Candidatus Babeliales bacterium]|nr:TonB C-terminal domain-containing protein [Candidatus Babeliales bacterium]
MWLWQQQRFAKKTKFIGKLIMLSFFIHMIGSFCFLCVYKGYDKTIIHIQSVAQNVIVRVMPLGGIPKKTASQKTSLAPRLLKKTGEHAVSQKQPLLKKIVSQTKTTLKKVAPQKKIIKKPEPVKKIIKKSVDSVVPQSRDQNVKKEEVKKNIEPLKKINNVKNVKEEKEKEVIKQSAPLESSNTEEIVSHNEEEIVYLSQKDYNAFEAHAALQEAIIDVWTPPAGMADNLVCVVSLIIDWNGSLKESVIDDSSGVPIYDIAVGQALEQVKIPRALWGKSLTVAFKP